MGEQRGCSSTCWRVVEAKPDGCVEETEPLRAVLAARGGPDAGVDSGASGLSSALLTASPLNRENGSPDAPQMARCGAFSLNKNGVIGSPRKAWLAEGFQKLTSCTPGRSCKNEYQL